MSRIIRLLHRHFANGLTALYLATGQDAACVAESATGVTRFETAARVSFHETHWNNRRWNWIFQLFFSRKAMGALGRDPEFFRYVEGSVAARILARTRHAPFQQDRAFFYSRSDHPDRATRQCGLRMFAASMLPLADPAPSNRWISIT